MRRTAFLVALVSSFIVVTGPVVQSQETQGGAGTRVSPVAPSPARVIDVEAARRVKHREHSFRIHRLPLLPIQLLGRGMEKGLVTVDRHHLLDQAQYYMMERERGLVPLFGGLGIGTGFTLGAKYYHNNFLRPGGRLDIPARVSSLLYQEYGLAASIPLDSRQRVFFDSGVYYRVRTQDDFFGLGNDSRLGDRTSYMLKARDVFFGPRFELARGLRLVTQLGYRDTDIFDGKDRRFPVITARFSPGRIPGLGDGARQWVGGAALVYDGRDVPERPRRGGYHRFAAGWHQSADSNDFGFWRYEVEAQRYVPLWSRSRTLALRFLGITNQARGGSSVPFFEQAILGGSNTMRAFREFRFRDLSGILMSAEYRYNLNSFMDLVLFLDEGQVAREPGDFGWRGLRTGYGIGFRFLTSRSTPFKIVFGRSREGTRIYFSMGATF